jgi:hypothetical protein
MARRSARARGKKEELQVGERSGEAEGGEARYARAGRPLVVWCGGSRLGCYSVTEPESQPFTPALRFSTRRGGSRAHRSPLTARPRRRLWSRPSFSRRRLQGPPCPAPIALTSRPCDCTDSSGELAAGKELGQADRPVLKRSSRRALVSRSVKPCCRSTLSMDISYLLSPSLPTSFLPTHFSPLKDASRLVLPGIARRLRTSGSTGGQNTDSQLMDLISP